MTSLYRADGHFPHPEKPSSQTHFGGIHLARLTRHEILKEDHFLLAVEKIRNFFLTRRKAVLLGAGIFGVVLVLVLGLRYTLATQDEKSKDALSNALKLYHAPLTGSPEAPHFDVSFPSETQKLEKALAEFQTVGSRYASRTAGKIAKYYSGLCLRNLNRTDEAIKELEPLSKEKSDYGALALEVLGSIYENSGNTAKAIEVYQKLVADDAPAAPNSLDLLHLAKLYEQQNSSAEAVKIYQRVIKEFPGSSYASDAEQKLKLLSR
jgi:tetratricopeptide (TPR) repeat protein